jgi:hypothetical protein
MLSDIGNYYDMCHHSLYKNKAFYGVIITCINHKLWSPFWWFNSWTITTESKYMSVSGTSIGKFNIVFNISVETLRSFTYFVLTSVSTCRRFNIMLSDIWNYYNMCHYSFYKSKALFGVVIICPWSPFWWFTAWNIRVSEFVDLRSHDSNI